MTLQIKIYSSQDYTSSSDLERNVNRFLVDNEAVSITEVSSDRLVPGYIIKGYDIVVKYNKSVSAAKPIELSSSLYSILGDYSQKFEENGFGRFIPIEEFFDTKTTTNSNSVRVRMHRLRKKLKEIGYTIINNRKKGFALIQLSQE